MFEFLGLSKKSKFDKLEADLRQISQHFDGARYDGQWENQIKGMGGASDASIQNRFMGGYELSEQELSLLYRFDGFGKRLVTVVSGDMTRPGFKISGDLDDKLLESLETIGLQKNIKLALDYSRLYGGSILVMNIKGGGRLEQPLRASHGEIQGFMVYGQNQILNSQTDINKDPNSPRFGKIEYYKVRTREGAWIKIHYSRAVEFHGEPVPDDSCASWEARYWGDSVINAIYEDIGNLGSATQGIMNLISEFVIGKFKFGSLKQMLASTDNRQLSNAIKVMNYTKSLVHAVIMGPDDDYTRDSANVSGLPELWTKVEKTLCAKTGIPYSKLFGEATTGFASEDKTVERNYYDVVDSKRDTDLKPQLNRIILIQNNALKITDNPVVSEFGPLWEPTPKEAAEIRKLDAEADKIIMDTLTGYINYQVLTPEQVQKLAILKNERMEELLGLEPAPEFIPEDEESE